ncbi:MAG: PAS domain-containing protein [Dehalococcoidia bacterium]|jgi:PAS domain S-box-containing protein
MVGPDNTVSDYAPETGLGWLKVIGLIPMPLFIALIIAQVILGYSAVFEPPYLLPALNTLFLLIIPLTVAFLCWRGYVSTGALRILLIGCGMITLGFTSLAAGFAIEFPNSQNLVPTIQNTGALITALFVAPASLIAVWYRTPDKPLARGRIYVAAAYMSTLIATALLIIAAFRGWIPPFFLQDSGFTFLRMAVLGTAMVLFALSSILFLISFARWSGFAYWFGLGLTLVTIALIALLLVKGVGAPLSWTARVANYTGCVYMLIGVLTSIRLSHLERVPIADEIVKSFARSPANYNTLTKKQLTKLLERHLDLFENSGTGIVIIDKDGRFLMANKRVAASFKKSIEEIVGRSLYDFLPRETADRYIELNRQLLRTGGQREYEDTFTLPTGERTFLMVDTCLKDESGKYFAIQHSSIDITEKRRVEEALAASELRYRDLFNNTNNGVAVYQAAADGEDFIIKDFNSAAERIENVKKEDIIDKSVLHVFPGIKEFGLFDVLQRVWRTGVPEPHPITQYRDGRISGWRDNFIYRLSSGEIVAIYNDVTDRKQAEAEIAHLASFPENNPNPVIEINLDGKISYMNPVARLLFPDIASLGMNHPFLAGAEHLRKAFHDGKTHYMTRQFKIMDTWWEETVSLNPSMDNMRFYGTNITDRKLAEEAILKSKMLMQSVIDSTPDWMYVKDLQHKYLLVNKSFAEAQNVSPRNMIGRADTDFFSEELCLGNPDKDIIGYHADDNQAFQGHVVHNPRNMISWADGTLHIYDTYKIPLTDPSGQIYGALVYSRDITRQSQAEEALRESENLYHSLFENMLNGFAYCRMLFEDGKGKDFVYIAVNNAFEKLTGLKNVTGKKITEVIPGIWETDSALLESYGRVASTGIPETFETYLAALNMWLHISVYSPEKEYFVAVFEVITDRKNIESELKASHEEMRALAGSLQMAMEEERKRVGRMIHDDLAQTLTALQIELSGLTHKLPVDHKRLSAQAAAMNRLITLMDERVKHITTELRPPLLDDLGLSAAVKLSLKEFSKRTGIRHEVHCDPEDFPLDTDIAIALFRVLQESLTNIARHSEADMVTVHLKKLQDCISLQIKDNGKGIEKRELANKKSIGIIGMRERVAFFEGKMRISSPPGEGTTVDVKIPLGEVTS